MTAELTGRAPSFLRRGALFALCVLAVVAPRLMAAAAPADEVATPAEKTQMLCGPMCLAFCARWLGVEAGVMEVARYAGLDRTGASLEGLARAAAELGLEARPYRLDPDDLRHVTSRTPGIAHLDGDHFVVVWTDEDDSLVVIEPPHGLRRGDLPGFTRRWDGAILIVSRPGEEPTWLHPPAAAGLLLGALLGLVVLLVARRWPKARGVASADGPR